MTIDEKKLRELAEKATPGPWTVWTSNSQRRITAEGRRDGGVLSGYSHLVDGCPDLIGENRDNDLAFICAARTAVPELLDEVERLRHLESDAQAVIAAVSEWCDQAEQAQKDGTAPPSICLGCGWCGKRVGSILDADHGVAKVRAHTQVCESNPLVAQLAAMTRARDEACDLAESLRPDSLSASEWPHTTIIAELRKVGAS